MQLDKLEQCLLRYDEVMMLELLDISTEDLIHRFHDRIVSRYNYLCKEVEMLSQNDDEESELNFED